MAGRWLYRGKSDSVHAPCDTHPYGEQLFRFHDEQGPSDVNLALILAAPELLDALKACDELLRGLPDSGGFYGLAVLEASAAAIAKAEGFDNDPH